MSGSPPQIETIGAPHSCAAARHFSSGTMSLRLVEYSRIRPQPVQVKLQVCSGSNCKTMANLGVLSSLCLTMWRVIFAVSARGKRIGFSLLVQRFGRTLPGEAERKAKEAEREVPQRRARARAKPHRESR